MEKCKSGILNLKKYKLGLTVLSGFDKKQKVGWAGYAGFPKNWIF